MIKNLQFFHSTSFDPYYNLAAEQHLMNTLEADTAILFLWQNQNTVVLGRNQNPWRECRTSLLEADGGHLARRFSGGGAVYHDLGNLNFTFLLPTSDYDVPKQLSVILQACRELGIPAEATGRNDLTVEGKKFSGNAFYKNGTVSCHHGTLMVQVDREKLGRYLNPSPAKLQAKGVASVRSRVVNLADLCPGLTCADLHSPLKSAFSQVYGLPCESCTLPSAPEILALRREFSSWEWLYGPKLPFTFSCESHFPWGELTLSLNVDQGTIRNAKVSTDSMDWTLAQRLEAALTGRRFALEDMSAAIGSTFESEITICHDLIRMLAEQEI